MRCDTFVIIVIITIMIVITMILPSSIIITIIIIDYHHHHHPAYLMIYAKDEESCSALVFQMCKVQLAPETLSILTVAS